MEQHRLRGICVMACCCHSDCRSLRMMDVVFALCPGREDAFVCELQQSRLPLVVRKDRASAIRTCHAADVRICEITWKSRLSNGYYNSSRVSCYWFVAYICNIDRLQNHLVHLFHEHPAQIFQVIHTDTCRRQVLRLLPHPL